MSARPVSLTRRRLLGMGAGAAIAACAPGPSPAARPSPTPGAGEKRIVGDVVDVSLKPQEWKGPFGSVTMKLHRGLFDGQDVHYIRTDASERTFATKNGLVFVPLLATILNAPDAHGELYLFANGSPAVFSSIPGRADYSPAWRVQNVKGGAKGLSSVAAIKDAAAKGSATVETTDVFVNHPLVRWPGGGLPVDPDLAEPLGKGPLLKEPDLSGGTVTFKLHQCFPGSRYIVTDTSAAPMAPMMGVVGSAPTQKLKAVGATAPITIFVNGLKGPGVMGFQPAIFNTTAGDPAWSPFWDHFAVKWKDASKARVVRSQKELDDLVSGDDLERFNGLPDTHPNGFVVNCPSPVLAPNDYVG